MQDLSNWATCRDEIDRNLLHDFPAAAAVLLILPRNAQALCRIAHQRVRDFMRDSSDNSAPRADSYEVCGSSCACAAISSRTVREVPFVSVRSVL